MHVCSLASLSGSLIVTLRPPLHEIFASLFCMRTSRKTDFRWNKGFHSSKNNFRRHDISQGLDREPPSVPSFSLAHIYPFKKYNDIVNRAAYKPPRRCITLHAIYISILLQTEGFADNLQVFLWSLNLGKEQGTETPNLYVHFHT